MYGVRGNSKGQCTRLKHERHLSTFLDNSHACKQALELQSDPSWALGLGKPFSPFIGLIFRNTQTCFNSFQPCG
jgi:hypothetical protein